MIYVIQESSGVGGGVPVVRCGMLKYTSDLQQPLNLMTVPTTGFKAGCL